MWDQKAIDPILSAMERAFEHLGVDYYVVGALARDLWFQDGLRAPARATQDIDLAVHISDEAEFQAVKDHLTEHEGFTASKKEAFAIDAPDGTRVDLIPFGDIEENGAVDLEVRNKLEVTGFRQVHEAAVEAIEKEGEGRYKVATLAGIAILKLISWSDRPDKRDHDIKDVSQILKEFFHVNDDRIWEEHNDLFGGELELDAIAARVLGRDMGAILRNDKDLHDRITGLLAPADGDEARQRILEIMTREREEDLEANALLLDEVLVGIREGSAPS